MTALGLPLIYLTVEKSKELALIPVSHKGTLNVFTSLLFSGWLFKCLVSYPADVSETLLPRIAQLFFFSSLKRDPASFPSPDHQDLSPHPPWGFQR